MLFFSQSQLGGVEIRIHVPNLGYSLGVDFSLGVELS